MKTTNKIIFTVVIIYSGLIFGDTLTSTPTKSIANDSGKYLIIDFNSDWPEIKSDSNKLHALKYRLEAAQKSIDAKKSDRMPELSLDASYKFIDSLNEMEVAPNRKVVFGTHNNYSIGPSLNYLVTDFGVLNDQIKALEQDAIGVENQNANEEIKLKLAILQNYLLMELKTDQIISLFNALKLANDQENDASKRMRLGIGSNLDYLKSKKETSNLKLELLGLLRNLSNIIIDRNILIGSDTNKINNEEESLAIPHELVMQLPVIKTIFNNDFNSKYFFVKIVRYKCDTEENKSSNETVDQKIKDHPFIKLSDALIASSRFSRDSIIKNYFPKIKFNARSSYDYPNGNNHEFYQQNYVGINFQFSIWDGNRKTNEIAKISNAIKAYEYERKDRINQYLEETRKIKTNLTNIQNEINVASNATSDIKKIALLTYQSYLNGKTNYLEVESANNKILEWEVKLAKLEYDKKTNYALLDYYINR